MFDRIRHPVVWIGALISRLDGALNRESLSERLRCSLGLLAEAAIASSLLASRGLYLHVAAVAMPLARDDLEGAREAVSRIVGRDPALLDPGQSMVAAGAADGLIVRRSCGKFFGLAGIRLGAVCAPTVCMRSTG